MNDLELRTTLHRTADLVGEPSPHLLEQLSARHRRERRQHAGIAVVVAAVVVIGAGVPVVASLARHSDAAPATQPTPAPTPSAPSEPTATTPAATATTPASPSAPPDELTLGPDGLGSLKLGMSRTAAEATDMVEPWLNEPNSLECLWRTRLRGAPADEGVVLYSETLGVATIDAPEGIQTPEGIEIGSSLAAVRQAYPDWREPPGTGHSLVLVPGHSEFHYRIGYADGKVTHLTLQYVDQDCYE